MLATKKFVASFLLAAGLGGALFAAPTANAAVQEQASQTGCVYNNDWHDICPVIVFDNHDDRNDAQDRSRDRRRNNDRRDRHEDHGDQH